MKKIILILCLLFTASCTIQKCPDEWIVNEMPCVYNEDPSECQVSEYFIINGERVDIDKEWVKANCDIEPTIVQ